MLASRLVEPWRNQRCAAPAKQAGSSIGKDIAAVVAGLPCATFRYLNLRSMAIVDGSSAIADLRGLKFSGLVGVLLWAGVHLGLIHDMQQRVSLTTKCVFALITRQRAVHVADGDAQRAHRDQCSGRPFSNATRYEAINCFPRCGFASSHGLLLQGNLRDVDQATVEHSRADRHQWGFSS